MKTGLVRAVDLVWLLKKIISDLRIDICVYIPLCLYLYECVYMYVNACIRAYVRACVRAYDYLRVHQRVVMCVCVFSGDELSSEDSP